MRPIDVDYKVSYRRANNKWHLSYAQASINFRVKSKKEKINSVFHSVSDLLITDTPSYAMLVQAKAYAVDHYIKPLMSGGKEYYVLFVKPGFMAKLKQSADYQAAIIQAADRGMTNPFFTGGTVTVDGLIIHEHRLVYSTLGTATKWGTGTNIEGSRSLLCGAQALGMADLGAPEWNEKEFQYGSSQGINVDKMLGFLKPKFYSIYDKSEEDFGVLAIDHAL